MGINSRLFECSVYHERTKPKAHKFRYRHLMFFFDLDELDNLAKKFRLFGHNNKWSIYNFCDSDHLEESQISLKNRAIGLLRRNGDRRIPSRVYLLANPRVFGYVFNPLSVYFFYDEEENLYSVICEICNTFKERKAYVLSVVDGVVDELVTKNFYISPYCKLDDKLLFKLKDPLRTLDLKVDTVNGDQAVVKTSLTGRQMSLSELNLLRSLLLFPLPTLATIVRIHWHASLLFLKGVPYERKEDNPDMQTDLMRPLQNLKPPSFKKGTSRESQPDSVH